jgi:protoporphyrinogen oxidase
VKVQHLIIGAGPTGLGAAWRLQQRGIRDWALLEGGHVAGGLAQSVVDDHGFTWDLGGHVQFSHYEMFDQLMDDLLGADGWLYHDRESWVWIAGRFVPYPFQLNLHRLPESERSACLRGLDEAAMAASQSSRAPENFGEWIDRTFGAGIAAVRDLEYSSTHVIGVGLHGAPPAALAQKCWIYFPEANCSFYRVTHFSHYSPNNVPDHASQWSLMAEVSESAHRPVDEADVVADVVRGLIATSLVASEAQVHHVWHTRLEHGYPVPSRTRDRGLGGIQSTFEARGVFSRGRFGAWKYEVSNQDHSFAQGVEAIDAWLDGSEEITLRRPDEVNARRPSLVARAGRA